MPVIREPKFMNTQWSQLRLPWCHWSKHSVHFAGKKKNSMEEFHSLTLTYMWTKMTQGMSMYHSVHTWIYILTIVYNKKELQLTLGRAGTRESEELFYPIKSTTTATTTILFYLIHRISYSKKKIIKCK